MSRRSAVAAIVGLLAIITGCGSGNAGDSPTLASGTPSQSPPITAAAEAFIELSGEGADRVPWADEVTYSIGGAQVGTVTPGATLPDDLSSCLPGRNEVEGHTCPVSPLKVVAEFEREATIELETPDTVGCNLFVAPDVPPGLVSTTIRPPEEQRNCFSDFAVTLYVDSAGAVQWLDFSLSGP